MARGARPQRVERVSIGMAALRTEACHRIRGRCDSEPSGVDRIASLHERQGQRLLVVVVVEARAGATDVLEEHAHHEPARESRGVLEQAAREGEVQAGRRQALDLGIVD